MDALWAGTGDRIRKLRIVDGATLFDTTDLPDVRQVAVDPTAGTLWALGAGPTLRAYGFGGTPGVTIPLGPLALPPYALAANALNGSVWVGAGPTLLHYSAAGALLQSILLVEPVAGLAFDPTTERTWVATAGAIVAYDDTGTAVATLALGPGALVTALAVDRATGTVWVAEATRVRRFTAGGTPTVTADLAGVQALASDDAEGVWAATATALVRIAADGTVAPALTPFAAPATIVALVADPADQSVWVASDAAVRRVAADGTAGPALAIPGGIRHLALYADVVAPTVTITAPAGGATIGSALPTLGLSWSDAGIGVDGTTLALTVNGAPLAATCTTDAASGSCTPGAALAEGATTLAATVADHAGNTSAPATVTFTVDTIAPALTLTAPAAGLQTNAVEVSFTGSLSEPATLTVNGSTVTVEPDLSFTHGPVALVEGPNLFTLVATDAAGNATTLTRTVTRDTVAPAAVDVARVADLDIVDGTVTVTGAAGSAEAGASVKVTNTRTGASVTVPVAADGSFTGTLAALDGDVFTLVVCDAATNASPAVALTVIDLPPDPAAIAPPLDPTVPTAVVDATAFLYTGTDPVQTGVAPGTITRVRAALLRGRVLDRAGAGISGVTVTILDHPELGQTRTRPDGRFDLVVNGGGPLTVRYTHPTRLPAQRQVDAPWEGTRVLPDVVLIPLDAAVTTLELPLATLQIARGTVVSDADGTRQATLLVPADTTAQMTLADGTTAPLPTLHVRATEYTVGATGGAAMPGELPAPSAYTYAVELSIDEARAAGAVRVDFSQALPVYVENFLGFPVGETVPAGAYDRTRGQWVAGASGRVVAVIAVTDGQADLDTDGDGVADDPAVLAALGVTPAERSALASLYAPGQALWRVPVAHLTPWDKNWAFSPPDDVGPPCALCPDPPDEDGPGRSRRTHRRPRRGPGPDPAPDPDPEPTPPPDEDECEGSVLGPLRQTLGEVVAVTGTPYRLHYQSDRVPGRTAARTLLIPVSGPSVHPDLKRIELVVTVAGREFQETFPVAPNQQALFTWDGRDLYGRALQGRQRVRIRIGDVYDGVYQQTDRFGYNGNGLITGSRTRREVTLWTERRRTIGAWDARGVGLGGWTLDVHHVYDPLGRILLFGDGDRRVGAQLGEMITTTAGTGTWLSNSPCSGPAASARLNRPRAIAAAPDGSLYIVDELAHRVCRVTPTGLLEPFAGTGTAGFGGDGGPATAATLRVPRGIALGPDGSVYIADADNRRIRRVAPNGIITTIAGTGVRGSAGDDGPALEATLGSPTELSLAPDGSLYFADLDIHRIRRIGTDGTITTVAGTGVTGFAGDGGPARLAKFNRPWGLAVGPDGSLYIGDIVNNRIRQVTPDGIVRTIAGTGIDGTSGDGGPAREAQVADPRGLAVGPDGTVYFADSNSPNDPSDDPWIRAISPAGVIRTVAGTGVTGSGGDGGLATLAQLSAPYGLAVGPDGSLYSANWGSRRVRRILPVLPGGGTSDIVLASEDGHEVYVFDSRGRHLTTRDALTGVALETFGYDAAGRLLTVTDRDGQVTTIVRDAAGPPEAIVAPGGQATTLTLDPHGYLATIANPAGETTTTGYTAAGLLTTLQTPRGHVSTFTYDAAGRLLTDADPAGGLQTLARTAGFASFTTTLTTLLGRTAEYTVTGLAAGGLQLVRRNSAGLATTTTIAATGTRTLDTPHGETIVHTAAPDPRFGMQAPVWSRLWTTPGGLQESLQATRSATLADPIDPLSVTQAERSVSRNGRTSTRTYAAGPPRTLTDVSPAGRQRVRTLDAAGRVVADAPAGLAPFTYAYDATGLLTTLTQGSGTTARTTTLGYDAAQRLTSITNALGQSVTWGYDGADRVTTLTLPDTRVVTLSYDANGNLAAVIPPGRPTHAFGYTPVDRLAGYTPPALGTSPVATTYSYNVDRQLTAITRPDGEVIALGYDAAGRQASVTTAAGTTTAGYDGAGRLATLTAPGPETLTLGYDGALPVTVAWSGSITGSVGYTYDDDFRVTETTVNGASPVAFQYDADGLLTQAGGLTLTRDPQHGGVTATALGSVTDTSTYNAFGEVADYSASANGTPLLAFSYTRDGLGRITARTETAGSGTSTTAYAYDAAGHLATVTTDGVETAAYDYDANGNRLARTTPTSITEGTYDDQDRLLQYGDAAYTYTANGELATKTVGAAVTNYAYGALGNLRGVTLPDGTTLEYVIDGANRRIGKKVDGTLVQGLLYQDTLRPIAELDGTGNVVSRFVYGSRPNVPEYIVKGGATYRVIADHLGSPRLVIDSTTGVLAQALDYDEFGRVTLDTNPGFQPFGFAGGLYDPATGLVRFGARDYDPETGRWTAKDPILFGGGDTNLYGYVLNDPINWIDPLGLYGTRQCAYYPQAYAANGGGYESVAGRICSTFRTDNVSNCIRQCLQERHRDRQPQPGKCTPDNNIDLRDNISDHAACIHGCFQNAENPYDPNGPALPDADIYLY